MRIHRRTTSKDNDNDNDRTTTHPAPQRTPPLGDRGSLPQAQRAYGNRAVGALLGQPLEPGLRARLESRLGADFTDVRLHLDAKSPHELGAPAVTSGEHIYVAQGEHRPDSAAGARLLTHELAHVVQQRGPAGTPLSAGRAEAEADAAVADGARPTPGSVPAGVVQPADPILGRQRYPHLPWDKDRSKALSMLTPEQRMRVEAEEREIAGLSREQEIRRKVDLQDGPGKSAEEQAAPPEPALLSQAWEYAALAGSTITGHTLFTWFRDRVPNEEGATLAKAIGERTRPHGEIADALEQSDNPERVAAAIMRSPFLASSLPLDQMAGAPDGRRLLDLLHRHLTAGMTGPVGSLFRGAFPLPLMDDSDQLMRAAARVMKARVSATPVERWAEAAAHPEKIQIFPFQMQGVTTSPQSRLEPWITPEGKLRVRLLSGTSVSYREDWEALKKVNAVLVDVDPDEIIGVRRYDLGGVIQHMPARELFQLDQEFRRNTAAKVQLTGALGAAVAGGGGAATTRLGKALLWGDRAALALSSASPVIEENRYWLERSEFKSALDTFDVLNAASQWYSLGRLAQSAPELLSSLHQRREKLRELRRELGESVPPERAAALDAIERGFATIPEPGPAAEPVGRAATGEGANSLPRGEMDPLLIASEPSQEMARMVSDYRRSRGLGMEQALSAVEQSQEVRPRSTRSRKSGSRAAGPGTTAVATSGSVKEPPPGLFPLPETPPRPRPAFDTAPTGNSAEPLSAFQAYAPDPLPSVGSQTRLELPPAQQPEAKRAPAAEPAGPVKQAPSVPENGPLWLPPAVRKPPPVAEPRPEQEQTSLELVKKVPLIQVPRGSSRMKPEIREIFRGLPEYLDPLTNTWKQSPGTLRPDHFVSVSYILNEIIGHRRLKLLQGWQITELLTYEGNFQALPDPLNGSKGGQLPTEWWQYKDRFVDAEWLLQSFRHQQRIIAELRQMMNGFIDDNQSAAKKSKKKK